jgi:hypothetical protein
MKDSCKKTGKTKIREAEINTNLSITPYTSAVDLPGAWDNLALSYFQTRAFLEHAERYNPCAQVYYLATNGQQALAAAVQYELSLNLFTYGTWRLPLKMHIIGIPCSVSASGVWGEPQVIDYLLNRLFQKKQGLTLCLNNDFLTTTKKHAAGFTLPTVALVNTFPDFPAYLANMRSSYRRRYKFINARFKGIEKRELAVKDFSEAMYNQYLSVLDRSKGKLETLPFDFFRRLPEPFKLFAFYSRDSYPVDSLLGWYIVTFWQGQFDFFLGGFDYTQNAKFRTYLNMLFEIIKDGISVQAAIINLGQTAEIPKLCTGARLYAKHMTGHHSFPLFNLLLRWGKSALMYRAKFPGFQVFKA